ncbi:phosphoribosylformylglycinamidine synthase I [Cyanobium sp. Cruz-8H5]|uniref:phosphoribosylformylglycinamidine synthase I n=1 Tax=Cyanobium sp. Cruz-8H5 TaxID=2823712 RepID=UPI0020CD0208|nr:phosphoribosylformylglycinamidine synthase I [Cyanobium sp. Cruz-8H5]MCP9861414.1 phosphoribosylformylglycinamidine synthase I [Cyanobium sp. Cruz-8H5]
MSVPRVMVLRSAGTNCDAETQWAFEQAGASVEKVHINRLAEAPELLGNYAILAIPGGFSYGDDISAGRILAQRLATVLLEPLKRFVDRGGLVAGICNGFQVLVKTDLLPGRVEGESGHPATLAHNTSGRFQCRWIDLDEVSGSRCIWTKNLGRFSLPIAHGEGRFAVASDAVLESLVSHGQIALRYAPGELATADGVNAALSRASGNPNGSVDGIAGVCDTTGRVFGLMPHPERHVRLSQHPAWTARGGDPDEPGPGLHLFRNAVDACRS